MVAAAAELYAPRTHYPPCAPFPISEYLQAMMITNSKKKSFGQMLRPPVRRKVCTASKMRNRKMMKLNGDQQPPRRANVTTQTILHESFGLDNFDHVSTTIPTSELTKTDRRCFFDRPGRCPFVETKQDQLA
jgi:hypothetical protein